MDTLSAMLRRTDDLSPAPQSPHPINPDHIRSTTQLLDGFGGGAAGSPRATTVIVAESIDMLPQRGVSAWLRHVYAKRRRGAAMRTIEEVLF
jgi:hypothetical protein